MPENISQSIDMKRRTLLLALGAFSSVAIVGTVGVFWGNSYIKGHLKQYGKKTDFGTFRQFDFNKVWFGSLLIKSDLPSGTKIRVRFGETINAEGRIDNAPPGSVRYYETDVVLTGKDDFIELSEADFRGMQDYGMPVMPFRFVEIEAPVTQLDQISVDLIAAVAADFQKTGSIVFLGNDLISSQLNRLVEFGFHTVEATSFMGIFVDGDRERIPYQADAYINQLSWHVVTHDMVVPRRTLSALFELPTWPSEWMVQMIFLVWADYQMSGDLDYLAQTIDRLVPFSLIEFMDDSGLVTTRNEILNKRFVESVSADYLEDIVDWPPVERDGYELMAYNTVVNAFVARGQTLMAAMYTDLGRHEDAEKCNSRASTIRQIMQQKLYSVSGKTFIDGVGSAHKSAHAALFPLAFNMFDNNQIEGVIDHLRQRVEAYQGGFPCSVYAAQFLLDGLFKNGETDLALKLLLSTEKRSWFNMLDRYDATITHESWDPEIKENIDWTHAWGSALLNIIQRYVVGVHPLKPGWSEWSISPLAINNLSFTASVPTPHGPIQISADGTKFEISIIAPKATIFRSNTAGPTPWKIVALKVV